MDEKLLHVSSSPHIRSEVTTSKIMGLVALALLPASLFGIYNFGLHALALILICIAACVLTELIYEHFMHKTITVSDGSALVTGLLLALNLPPAAPLWIPVVGGVFAILIVKQLFGGLGQNIMNPALAARCFLLIAFTGHMTDFTVPTGAFGNVVDTVSGATPLAAVKAGESVKLAAMFFGNIKGTIGETSVVALLIGALFLILTKVISLRIPLSYILTFSVLILIYGLGTGRGFDMMFLAQELCGGGLMLGAWFMATDYVTAPITKKGQIFYGCLIGVFTWLFRMIGNSAEGVSYAIIFCNLLTPLIEHVTHPAVFGKGGKKA